VASELETFSVDINGFSSRVWKKGVGPPLGFLAGFGGLPRWIPFLDILARERTVTVPSLPGFPGGARGHTVLDSHLDWVLAVRQLLQKAGLDGADLAGSSVGASFAAETTAIWPGSVRRLVLIAPWGLAADRGADFADLGCGGPHHAAQLRRSLRRCNRRGGADHHDCWCRASGRARQAG